MTKEIHNYIKQRIAKISGLIMPAYDKYEARASIVDALTDLRHFSDKEGLDFYRLLETSMLHYTAELSEASTIKEVSLDVGTDDEIKEYEKYFDTMERANNIPLPFEAWKLTQK